MKKYSLVSHSLIIAALCLGACSKKNAKGDGEIDASMQTTDVSSGSAIAELGTVHFAFDSFALSGDSKETLRKDVDWITGHPSTRIQIEGHCDERGTTEYNIALGERRAGAVKDYLVAKGIPASRLTTISYGSERPVDAGHGEDAWAKNRRAEFVTAQ